VIDPNSTVRHVQHPHLPWYSVVVSRPHYQRAAPLCTCPQPRCVTICMLLLAAEPCAAIGSGAHADVRTALHARNSQASPHWPPPLADTDAWCADQSMAIDVVCIASTHARSSFLGTWSGNILVWREHAHWTLHVAIADSIVITTRLSLPHPFHSCEAKRGHIQRTARYDPGGGG
jgi:hypothetical protein